MKLAGGLKKYVMVEGEEKAYRLRYTNNALIELEDALGMGIVEFGEGLRQGKLRLRDIRSLIWAGLIQDNPELTQTGAGQIMDEVGLEPILKAAMEAFFAAFPAVEDKSGGEHRGNPVELSGTGKTRSEALHRSG